MAFDDLFEVFWTERILAEWIRNVGIDEDRAKCETRTVPLMRRWFPQATLPPAADEPLGKTDLGDVHVARAALAIAPSVLLTWNVKDFDLVVLDELGVEVTTPDAFLIGAFDLDPPLLADLTRRAMANLSRSAPSWSDYLDILERNALVGFVDRLRSWPDELADPEEPSLA